MGFMRTSATFLSRCFVYVCACVLLFLLLLLNSSVVFWGFTLNDWWQIAWYMKFPYLSFDSLCTTIFSSSSSFSFCYTWPISFRNYFFFVWMQTIFAYLYTFSCVVQTWILLLLFFFCKLSIVSSGFVLDLFLLFCNILWSCWLRLLFAILDYLLRSYFWVNFMFVFILLHSNVLNFSWNISDWMKEKNDLKLAMSDEKLAKYIDCTCQMFVYLKVCQWIVHTCISCTRQNSLNLHNKRTFFVTTIATKFCSNKNNDNNVKIFGNKIWHKYGNLFYRFALIMHKNTAFRHKKLINSFDSLAAIYI